MIRSTIIAAFLALCAVSSISYAQNSSAMTLQEVTDALVVGLPETEVTEMLGNPTRTMPGRGNDRVNFYNFSQPDGTVIMIVVVIDAEGRVFRHRVYQNTGN